MQEQNIAIGIVILVTLVCILICIVSHLAWNLKVLTKAYNSRCDMVRNLTSQIKTHKGMLKALSGEPVEDKGATHDN